MEQQNPSNVKNFKRRIHINLGTIVFGLVFLYILCCVILYFTRNRVSVYEVEAGSIVENQTYTGIAFRQEQVFNAESSGNLTYIASEGRRVSRKTPVYSASTQGDLAEILENNVQSATLTKEDLMSLSHQVSSFASAYSPDSFQQVYPFKSQLDTAVMDAADDTSYSDDQSARLGIYNAQDSGIVVYSVDGFENDSFDTFTPEMLDKSTYKLQDLKTRETVNQGDPVYKLITDENWEVIIRLDDSRKEQYQDDDYVEVRFLKDHTTAWGQISKFEKDGDTYCRLKFTNSMVRFATDRYLELEVLLESSSGLKVPNSAIVEKEFYTVPRDFVESDSEENKRGVYIYEVNKKGEAFETYQEITPYNVTDKEVYLNMDDIKAGTTLIKKGSAQLYTVGDIGKLIGVYNVNKGYADFSTVTMLYQNDDYSIVKANESYGLTQYDRIVLDGSSVNDEETIYQ